PGSLQRRQLTHGSESVSRFAWRPDGKAIAFRRADPSRQLHGAAAFRDGLHVGDNAYLDEKLPVHAHLWLATLSGTERRLGGEQHVMDSPLSWSPDGRSIIFETGPPVYGLSDRAYPVRLDISDANTAAAAGRITPATAFGSEADVAEYSPDGTKVAYLRPQNGDLVNQWDAWVASRADRRDRDVTLPIDRYVTTSTWMPDGISLLVQVDDRAEQPLIVQKLDGTIHRLPLGPVVAAVIQPTGSVAKDGTVVFIGDQRNWPDELYLLRPHETAPLQLTSFNAGIASLRLGKVERVSWRSSDGMSADGVLTFPVGYRPGHKYPLVVRIHGGPNESSTVAFYDFPQLAAGRGYVVLQPNYRGSTDLGARWVRAILDDPNDGPSRDIMEGIATLEKRGIVDPRHIGISGWSYGGMLTYWLETHHDFAAAVSGAGVADLVADYAIADDIDWAHIMFRHSTTPFRGNSISLWREQSAVTFAGRVRTPTLILCNIYDVRVPVVESYEMFHALRDNNVPVEFYAYPTTGHEPAGPVRWSDAYGHWLDWFDRYLK
ncbi:MAG: prolyl oligopeptidase family serine peptidase, partial [Candidatus Eremiobacteraeota bacterium]|nr:prolyl oligopeptidase family serine peptidase [Candidatus Eremiobacteraeota bacterium]